MSDNKTFTAKIEEMNTLGNGITKRDGCVVFCLGAVDGDTVTAEICEEKKNFKIAAVKSVDTPSHYRCEPDCPAYGQCGGCTLRHITYEHEAEIKLQSVKAALRRGGFGDIEVKEILTAEPERYRNKAVFRFKGGEFGYTEEKGAAFVPITDCRLCPEIFSEIAAFSAVALNGKDVTYLFLRCTKDCAEITAVIGTKNGDKAGLRNFAEALCEKFPSVVGVLTKSGNHPEDGKRAEIILGKDSVTEDFLRMNLKVSPDSFFQVNHDAAEKLCRVVGEYACIDGGSYGADLYCGTGILGLSAAALHPDCFITGVEINSAAVADAKENAAANGLSNIGFFCGDSADFAKSIYGSLDFATIDPPRQGCSDKMIKELMRIAPKRLVYVSCDPSSLARDLKKLCESKFIIEEVTACDLFPRTKHVETVVLLKSTKHK